MSIEEWLNEIIKDRGINLSEMARLIGVPYMALYNSLKASSREREIRGWELIKVCKFLDINPLDFAEETTIQ